MSGTYLLGLTVVSMLVIFWLFGPIIMPKTWRRVSDFFRRVRRPFVRVEPRNEAVSMASTFLVKPYLQLGDSRSLSASESVEVLWHTKENQHRWQVQVQVAGESDWREPVDVVAEAVHIAKMGDHQRFRVKLTRLVPGAEFEYRVLADGAIAFGATGKARNGDHQPFTFVAVGDLGKPTSGNIQAVAARIAGVAPDLIVLSGDIVYERGRVSEYLENVFPVYNADAVSSDQGAPLLRSRVVIPSLGNHDAALPSPQHKRDFGEFNDLLGYFIFWSVPLNGPQVTAERNAPRLEGEDTKAHRRFVAAAGERYPRTGCYSFDWGNAHFLVLDSNAYVDWTDQQLVDWVTNDLAQARYATWRFVVYHHPSFSSDLKHSDEQRMRLLAPVFERWSVDVVFTGHNHCYERSRPVRFAPEKQQTVLHTEECAVPGQLLIDTAYDGVNHREPDGVIYVVDGAGGAKIYPHSKPESTKSFTAVYDQSKYSFTRVSVTRNRLTAVQIAADGTELDRWVIDKR